MNATSNHSVSFESTYALLVRSEEKHRSRFETFVYSVLIANALFAVSQFGGQALAMPASIPHIAAVESTSATHRS